MPRLEVARAWRYSRYDDANTACTRLAGRIGRPKTLWSFTCPDGHTGIAVAADTNFDERTEVFVTGRSSIYLLAGANGKLLWEKPLSVPGRPVEISSAAAIFDVNMDGRPEIIVAAGDAGATVVTGNEGVVLWQHPTFGGAGLGFGTIEYGERDIIQSDLWERNVVYRLRGRDGFRIWEVSAPGQVYDLPVVSDVNGDGSPEVIFHTNSGNGVRRERCVCLSSAGDILWSTEISPLVPENSPTAVSDYSGAPVVVADFLGDGGRQILVTTDTTLTLLDGSGSVIWQAPTGFTGAGKRTVHRVEGGAELQAPRPDEAFGRMIKGAAVGDIDGDGKPEVVVGLAPDFDEDCQEDTLTGELVKTSRKNVSGPRNEVMALRGDTGKVLWNYKSDLPCPDGGGMSAPIIADVDGDGAMEAAVLSADGHLHILKGNDGSPVWRHDVSAKDSGCLIFADVNDDGFGEIVAASSGTVTVVGSA